MNLPLTNSIVEALPRFDGFVYPNEATLHPLWSVLIVVYPYVTGLVAGAFVFFVHRAIVPSLRRRKVTGKEGMIGQIGEVTQACTPRGIIKVKDEYWTAKSLTGDLIVGEEVEIVSIDGLKVEVERRKS